jgi:hypothetical protein
MALKVKEMKDNAVVEIKVNKGYYQMVKAVSFYLFTHIPGDNKDEYLKDALTKSYSDMDDLQKSFYTVTLMLAEIELQVKSENLYTEKEILQPGDEGYVEPN